MLRAIVIACVASLAAAGAGAATIVTNGTFETPTATNTALSANSPTLTGWTVDSATGQNGGIRFGTAYGNGFTLSGLQSVRLAGSTVQEGGIHQTVATISGQVYTLSIDTKDTLSTVATGTFSFGGQTFTLNPASQTFQTSAWTETATGSSTLIDISGYSASGTDQLVIDNVIVSQVPTAWLGGTSIDWGTLGNWSGVTSVPNSAGVAVSFGTTGANHTVDLGTSNRTVGAVNFLNGTTTTISSSGSHNLVLDNGGSAAAITVSGSHSVQPGIQLNSDAVLSVTSGTDQIIFSGVVVDGSASHGLALSVAGTVSLAAANTFSGPTSVASGTLLLSNSAALQNSTLASGGLAFSPTVVPHAFTVGALSGSGGFALVDTSANPVVLSVGRNNASTTYSGALGDAGSLTKIGSGLLTMSGATTFNGNTLVSGGTLLLGIGSALQNSVLDTGGSGVFSFGTQTAVSLGGLTNSGSLNLVNAASQTVNLTLGGGGRNVTYSAALQGPGNLTMNGAGSQVLSGNNSYGGSTNIVAGTLQFQGGNSLPAASPVGLGAGTFSIRNDGSGSGGTINVGNNITLSAATQAATIDVGNAGSAHTGNTIAFGVLSNGTTADNLNSRITFTGANGYQQSFTALNLPGNTGQTTVLNPLTTSVIIAGNVTNQETSAVGFDTLQLDGITTGNVIYGVISDSAFFTGVGNGDTRITKSNGSQWILAATNTYSGPTLITAGTLQLGTGLSGQDGTIDNTGGVTNNGALVYNLFGSQTPPYAIGGGGSVTMNGPGSLTFSVSNNYTGPTYISSGTLALGNGGSIAQSSTISLAGGAMFDVSQASGFHLFGGQSLSGSGNYFVNGAVSADSASTILPGGATSAGTLNIGSLTLSPGSVLKYDLGSGQDLINITTPSGLNLLGGGVGLYKSDGTSTFSTPGTYLLMNYGNGNSIGGSPTNLSVLNPSTTNTYTFEATGGSVDVTISVPDTWNGGANPSFVWSNPANWSTAQAPVNGQSIGFSGTVGLTNTNDIANLNLTGILFGPSAGAFSLSGSDIQLGGGISNYSTAAQTIGLNIQLVGGNQNINAAAGNVVLNGVISDGGAMLGINTIGGGAVVLAGANTYTGTTNVTAGVLRLANSAAVQSSTVNLAPGGALSFAAGITSPTLGGLTGSGNVTLATVTSQPVALGVGGNGQSTTYGGVLSGPGGLVKQGSGTLTLTQAQTYGGATQITGGVLQLLPGAVFAPIPVTAGLLYDLDPSNPANTLNGANVTTLKDLSPSGTNSFTNAASTVTVASVSGFRRQVLYFSGNASATITMGNSTSPLTVFIVEQATGVNGTGFGYMFGETGADQDIRVRAGPVIQAGTNTNNNDFTGNGGTMYVNGSGPQTSNVTAGTAQLLEAFPGTSNGFPWPSTSLSNDAIGAAAGRYYEGYMGEVVAYNTSLSISDRQSVETYLMNKWLGTGGSVSGNLLPTASPVTISGGGTFDMTGVIQVIASLSSTDGLGSQVLLGNGALTIAGTASSTFDGVISGVAGSLVVQGGRMALTGTNTYTGGTTINGGTLQLGDGSSGHDGALATSSVNNNGLLVYNVNSMQTASYVIGSGGSLTKTGPGTLTLTNANSYIGATAINGGTLQLGDGTPGDDGSINNTSRVTDNGALVFDLAGSQSAAYAISGSGSLTKTGTGVLTLSNSANGYLGGTTVAAGTLIVTNSQAIADGTSLTVGNALAFPAPVVPSPIAGLPTVSSAAIAPVPEPGTFVLVLAGVIVGICIWRKKGRGFLSYELKATS